jgi:hypothetical protein
MSKLTDEQGKRAQAVIVNLTGHVLYAPSLETIATYLQFEQPMFNKTELELVMVAQSRSQVRERTDYILKCRNALRFPWPSDQRREAIRRVLSRRNFIDGQSALEIEDGIIAELDVASGVR